MDFIKNALKKVANVALLDPLEPVIRSFANDKVTEWRDKTLDKMPRRLPDMLRDTDDPDPSDDGFFEKIRDSAMGKVADVLERNLDGLIAWVQRDYQQELDEQTRDVSDKVTEASMKAMREQLHLVPSHDKEGGHGDRAFNPDDDDDAVKDRQDRALFSTPKDEHVKTVEERVRKYLRPRMEQIEGKLIEIYPKVFKDAAMKYFSSDGERAFDPEDLENNTEGTKERGFGDLFSKFTSSIAESSPDFMETLINGAIRVLDKPMKKLVRDQVQDLENDMATGAGEKARSFLDKVPGMK